MLTDQRNRYFETGEAKVLILDLLRKAHEPMRTDELANSIASSKGLSFDLVRQRSFNKSVINILSTLEKNSLVERVSKEGLTITWQIKAVA